MQPASWTCLQMAFGWSIAPTKQFQSYRRQPCLCNASSHHDEALQCCITARSHNFYQAKYKRKGKKGGKNTFKSQKENTKKA